MPKKTKPNSPVVKQSTQGRASWQARDHIEGVGEASCYYCMRRFKASEIKEWVDQGLTALCPRCGIDAVVAGKVDKATLMRWHEESFR